MGPVARLDGQVAVITGGSRGIGWRVSQGLADAGASVVMIGRDRDRLRVAADELKARGHQVLGLAADVAKEEQTRLLPGRLGLGLHVDVLVNCAGVMSERTAKTLRTTPEEWRRDVSAVRALLVD